ncbi:MAG: PIN domain-containing protein [Pseudonocardiaceae bacterium]|nr:PIN domain-containing protein [Pseudonocardiaceae bacterium]
MATLVDSNVVLDVVRADPVWSVWSERALARAVDEGPVVINPVVYAEVAASYETAEQVDTALDAAVLVRSELPWPAAFLAGRCHVEYRRRGGARTRTLPDFLIGAHAAVLGLRLLTRDASRYRSYFPKLEIIAPQ